MQGSRWVGWPEHKEVSWAWSCVRIKAVSSGLWEAEVQVTTLKSSRGKLGLKFVSPVSAACCWARGHPRVLLSHHSP